MCVMRRASEAAEMQTVAAKFRVEVDLTVAAKSEGMICVTLSRRWKEKISAMQV